MIGKRPVFTIVVMVVACVLLIGIDVYLAVNNTPGDTYSEIIADVALSVSALPWAVGGICGHWFWRGNRYNTWWGWLIVALGLVVLTVGDFVLGITHPLISFGVGMGSGRLVWAMKPKD